MMESLGALEIKDAAKIEKSFKEIRAEGDITLEEAKDFWDDEFDKRMESFEEKTRDSTDVTAINEEKMNKEFKEISSDIDHAVSEDKGFWDAVFEKRIDISIDETENERGIKNSGFENDSTIVKMEKMENKTLENGIENVEKKDSVIAKIENSLGTKEGIEALLERHPEKIELWKSQLEALDVLNDPEASPAEIRSAQAKLSILKGQLLETAVKDALTDAGFDVESQQRVVEGESGGTRPDVIAKNNTDHPIKVFGVTIEPGETISVECKCGGTAYMTNQLNNHIPNQLSGQTGTKILLTTSDIEETPQGLAKEVCDRYGAKLVIVKVGVSDVEKAIKEVAES